MSGELLACKLEAVGYHTSAESLDWLFHVPEADQFMSWICEVLEPGNVLSDEELKWFGTARCLH